MSDKLKIVEPNISLLDFFNEVIFGKYDDNEITNFVCYSDNFKDTYFIINESNNDEHISDFIKNNITAQSSGLEDLIKQKFPTKLSDKNISFESSSFNLSVIRFLINNNSIEIKILSIFEWYLSQLLFDDGPKLEFQSLINDKLFNLYSLNFTDIINNYQELLNDKNFQEIMENEKII